MGDRHILPHSIYGSLSSELQNVASLQQKLTAVRAALHPGGSQERHQPQHTHLCCLLWLSPLEGVYLLSCHWFLPAHILPACTWPHSVRAHNTALMLGRCPWMPILLIQHQTTSPAASPYEHGHPSPAEMRGALSPRYCPKKVSGSEWYLFQGGAEEEGGEGR